MAFTHRASNKAYASIFETPTLLNLVLNKSGEGNHIHIISSYPLHFIKTNAYIYLHRDPNVCTQSPLKAIDKVLQRRANGLWHHCKQWCHPWL